MIYHFLFLLLGDFNLPGHRLEQVQVIIRHGDRAPLVAWQNYDMPPLPCDWHNGLEKFKTEYNEYKRQLQQSHVMQLFFIGINYYLTHYQMFRGPYNYMKLLLSLEKLG